MLKARIFNFSKPLDNFTTLFLDNGAASLAGTLLADGHQVTIEDYGRLEMMEYFRPDDMLFQSLQALTGEVSGQLRIGASPSAGLVSDLKQKEKELKIHYRRKIDRLAQSDAERIFEDGLDVAMFKVWNGLGTYYFQQVTQRIKKLEKQEGRKVWVLGGGPQVGWFNRHVLRICPDADALGFGEGENLVKNVFRAIEAGRDFYDLPGLIYRKNGEIVMNPQQWIQNLDDLPKPVYDPEVYPAHNQESKVQFIMLDESRGCPNKCYFCNHSIESGDKWRAKSARRVVDEIEQIVDKFGLRCFRYSGSSTPPKLRGEIAREIIARNLDIRYTSFINTNTVTEEDFEVMAASGCFGVFFGVESGNPDILARSIGVKNTLDSIEFAVKTARKYGIYTVGSLIIPAPFDTEETIAQTLDFVMDIGIDSAPVVPVGLTGDETVWARESERFGIEKDEDWIDQMLFWDVNLNVPPLFWDRMPYKVNGKEFNEYIKITGAAAARLFKNGIPQIPDDIAMLARINGQDEKVFIYETDMEIKKGNYAKMKDRILSINQSVKNISLN